MPKGGRRVGAGRKKRGTVLAMPGVTAPAPATDPGPRPTGQVVMPTLSKAKQATWQRLAPHAEARGLLTTDTVPGFLLMLDVMADRDALKKRIDKEGWTFVSSTGDRKRHPLWGVWQVLTLRVEQEMARFGLIADAKPAAPGAPAAEENPWAAIAKR